MSKQKQYHAWYSQQAVDRGCGSSVYRSAKSHGNEVEVTLVVEAKDPYVPDKGGAMWPDMVYRGLVTDYVRRGDPGDGFDDLFDDFIGLDDDGR